MAQLQQHDLRPDAAEALVRLARVQPGDEVLEVGAGTGVLVAALLARGARVAAIEVDPVRAGRLRERFAAELADGRLSLLQGDALVLFPRLSPGWRIVANPPFAHTAALVRRWLLDDLPAGPPRAMHLVLQEHAARKLSGRPRQETRSSVLLRLAGEPRVAERLRRGDVVPPARVELAVFAWLRHDDAPSADELRRIDRVLERGFAGPHSMREALRGLATPAILKRQAAEHGWEVEAHPRTLRPEAWQGLTGFLHGLGKV